MKNKKTNHDKIIEAIEQDTLEFVYGTLEKGYQENRKIAVLLKGFYNKSEHKDIDFANFTSIPNGYKLESFSDRYGISTITKDKKGYIKTTGFFIEDLIKNKIENAEFPNKKNAEIYYIDAMNEPEYIERRIKSTEDKLIKEMNDKIEAYDSAIRNGTIHYMENDIKDNRWAIRDLKKEVIQICIWYGVFIMLLFTGFCSIFTKLPK